MPLLLVTLALVGDTREPRDRRECPPFTAFDPSKVSSSELEIALWSFNYIYIFCALKFCFGLLNVKLDYFAESLFEILQDKIANKSTSRTCAHCVRCIIFIKYFIIFFFF